MRSSYTSCWKFSQILGDNLQHGPILFYNFSYGLTSYADLDIAGDKSDSKSRSGFIFTYNKGCVSCTSKKQSTVALSTYQSEFHSLVAAAREGIATERRTHFILSV
jgi:hypothetical protein